MVVMQSNLSKFICYIKLYTQIELNDNCAFVIRDVKYKNEIKEIFKPNKRRHKYNI